MGPELIALASTAASTLVSAMTTDAWRLVRTRLGRLLGRGDPPAETAVLEVLDEDAQAIAGAGDQQAALTEDLGAQWTVRLRDLLRVEPDAAVLVRELVAELSAAGAGVSATGGGVAAGRGVRIRADRGGVAAGTIEGGVHLGNPPPPGTEAA
jgi:hypothetical protein